MLCINLLWLIGCLPIVTIGASTAAAFDVIIRMNQKEEGYLLRGYCRAFASNWKQGTALWAMIAGFSYVMWLNFQICNLKGKPVLYMVVLYVAIVLVGL